MMEKRRTQLLTDNLEAMSKIHSCYIANSKSELLNYGKDRTAEDLYTILKDAQLCDDEDDDGKYDEEEMMKLISDPFNGNDNNEQISFQNLEILDVLDLNSMFRNESN